MRIDENIEPIVSTARKIPYSQRDRVETELKRMEKLGVIPKDEEPTDWVNTIIVVNEPNGIVRLCMDPQRLNSARLPSDTHSGRYLN